MPIASPEIDFVLDPDSDFALRKIRKSDDPNADNTGFGLDLHIISDDGSGWKTLPVGRDGIEFCQGHQCWRGESTRVIASTLLFDTPLTATQELVEMESFPGNVHWYATSEAHLEIAEKL